MKYLKLETLTEFSCTGSECPSTCCAFGWNIDIDKQTVDYYKTVPGAMGEKLRKYIRHENGKSYFKLTEEGKCYFLNEQNLCNVYIELGEEHQGCTCKTYPRYKIIVGNNELSGVNASCSEVAKFLLEHTEPLRIEISEDDKISKQAAGVNQQLLDQALNAFNALFDIAQNRNYSIGERLSLITIFVIQFQSVIADKKDPSGLIELFSDSSSYVQILPQIGIGNRNYEAKVDYYSEAINCFKFAGRLEEGLPELNELISYFAADGHLLLDTQQMSDAYSALDSEGSQIWMENLIVYALFCYFLQGFEERDFFNKVMIGILLFCEIVFSTIALYHMRWGHLPGDDEMISIISHSSRAVEHNDHFRGKAIEFMAEKGLADPVYLFKLFS